MTGTRARPDQPALPEMLAKKVNPEVPVNRVTKERPALLDPIISHRLLNLAESARLVPKVHPDLQAQPAARVTKANPVPMVTLVKMALQAHPDPQALLAHLVRTENLVKSVLRARTASQGSKENRVKLESRVPMDRQDPRVHPAPKVNPDLQDPLAHWDQLERMVTRDPKVHRVKLAHRVHQERTPNIARAQNELSTRPFKRRIIRDCVTFINFHILGENFYFSF